MADYTINKVTISPNGKYIVSFIPGTPSHLIVFSAIDRTEISAREFPYSGGVTTSEVRALLFNSAGTSGFLMDIYSSGAGSAIYKYNPLSKT